AQGIALVTLAGVLFLGSSALTVSPITRGVLVAILAATLIVALENARGGFVKRMLSSGPFSYLGRISYGTYLWHWPVIVVLGYGRHPSPAELFVITLPTATALAAISYHALEHPVRTSRILDRFRAPVIAIGFSTSILVGALAIPAILDPGGGSISNAGGTFSSASKFHLLDWRVAKNDIAKLPDCLDAPVQRCTVARGTKQRVLLIGDSHAQMWLPAFESIANAESLTLSVAVLDACPWQRGLFYVDSGGLYRSCKRHQADWYDRVVPQLDPDVIILVQAGPGNSDFPLPLTFPNGRKLGFGAPGYDQALIHASSATLETLREPKRRIVIIEPIPATFPFDPLSCLSRGGSLGGCTHKVDARPTALEIYYRQASHEPNVSSLDLDRLVCPRLPICDPIVHDVIVRRDANSHLTATFARSVSAAIERIMHTRGILGST
nr:acyltransferase [Actinomycetota bacterium]